jgi:hypothetical protein
MPNGLFFGRPFIPRLKKPVVFRQGFIKKIGIANTKKFTVLISNRTGADRFQSQSVTAAVRLDNLTVDPAALWTRQEGYDLCDIIGLT